MVQDIFDLTGKVALVTGGSKGLGKAMARGLVEAGADILITSRHEEELRGALDEIVSGTGRRGRYLVADMSRRADVSREIEELTGRKVIGFMSDNHIDPDLAVEVFVLEPLSDTTA